MSDKAEQAKIYQRKKHLAALAQLAVQVTALIVLLSAGLAFTFRDWAQSLSGHPSLQVLFYYGFFFDFVWLCELPLEFYSGFRLEERYGLSNQDFKQWAVEFLKRTVLVFVISALLVLGLYAAMGRSPGRWWVWAWLGYAGFSYLLGQLFPVLIVPLFYRYSRVEKDSLKERIFRLVKRFRLPVENVYSLNLSKTTKKANAMFAGLGRTKRLVLSDTLIRDFTEEEIESVVAHELGHYKHHDIWHHLAFSAATSFVGFFLAFEIVKRLGPRLGFSGAEDLAAFPFLYLVFTLLGIVLTPLSHAYSRWREAEADRFSLEACGSRGFIPAMEKLAKLNLADPEPHPLIEYWFYTHPPIAKRIRMAKKFLGLLFVFAALSVFEPARLWAYESYADESYSETGARSEREEAKNDLENRGRTEIMNFLLGRPKDTAGLKVPLSIELYNQAVEFYQKNEFDLAREALKDSLSYDPRNAFAHELLGDIAYYEQKLGEAEEHYLAAFRVRARNDLKEKIFRTKKERKVEATLTHYPEEHFIIMYRGEEKGIEGYGLSEALRKAYREVGQDLGYFFKHKVPVLLYDEKEFRDLIRAPHWTIGVYDGKIRLPAYEKGFSQVEIQKVMRHELTHAFVVEISRRFCPPWLNEGLAEYEESKISAPDLTVFRAAVRSKTLFPIETLLGQEKLLEVKDPLEAELFYEQSFQLVSYLAKRYGMFPLRKMLEEFAEGKDSFEVIQEVLKISPLELEKEWIATLSVN